MPSSPSVPLRRSSRLLARSSQGLMSTPTRTPSGGIAPPVAQVPSTPSTAVVLARSSSSDDRERVRRFAVKSFKSIWRADSVCFAFQAHINRDVENWAQRVPGHPSAAGKIHSRNWASPNPASRIGSFSYYAIDADSWADPGPYDDPNLEELPNAEYRDFVQLVEIVINLSDTFVGPSTVSERVVAALSLQRISNSLRLSITSCIAEARREYAVTHPEVAGRPSTRDPSSRVRGRKRVSGGSSSTDTITL